MYASTPLPFSKNTCLGKVHTLYLAIFKTCTSTAKKTYVILYLHYWFY